MRWIWSGKAGAMTCRMTVKSELGGQAAAELSGAEQLAAIVDQHRKG